MPEQNVLYIPICKPSPIGMVEQMQRLLCFKVGEYNSMDADLRKSFTVDSLVISEILKEFPKARIQIERTDSLSLNKTIIFFVMIRYDIALIGAVLKN